MNKFEFISLKEYPEGPYPTAIATVRINLKDENGHAFREVVRFARKELKAGGVFWAMSTHCVMINNEKKYFAAFELDSAVDTEILVDFIKENVKRLQNPVLMSGSVHEKYPHNGTTYQAHVQSTAREEYREETQPLPF